MNEEKNDKINWKEIVVSTGVSFLFTVLYVNRENIYKRIRGFREKYRLPVDLEGQYRKFEEKIFERAGQMTDERIDRRIEEYMKRQASLQN